MSEGALAILAALLGGGLIAGLVQVYRARADRDSTLVQGASAAATGISQAASTLIGPLQSELSRVQALQVEMAAEIAALRKDVQLSREKEAECQLNLALVREEMDELKGVVLARRKEDQVP